MPRKHEGAHHTTKQKGRSLSGRGPGAYARKHKSRKADHYDRPYLDGTYRKEAK